MTSVKMLYPHRKARVAASLLLAIGLAYGLAACSDSGAKPEPAISKGFPSLPPEPAGEPTTAPSTKMTVTVPPSAPTKTVTIATPAIPSKPAVSPKPTAVPTVAGQKPLYPANEAENAYIGDASGMKCDTDVTDDRRLDVGTTEQRKGSLITATYTSNGVVITATKGIPASAVIAGGKTATIPEAYRVYRDTSKLSLLLVKSWRLKNGDPMKLCILKQQSTPTPE